MRSFYFIILLLIVPFSFLYSQKKDLQNAQSYASDAYSYAKKAYYSSNLNDLKYYIKKAKDAADDALTEIRRYKCSGAESAADDCYTQAKRAYNSSDFEKAKNYARKAMKYAEDITSELDDCQ